MTSPPPTGTYQLPPQYGPIPQPGQQPSHRAATPSRRLSRRAWFWAFIGWHALMVLAVAGAGAALTWATTFDILGIWAAVDVMLAAGVGLWRLTAPRT
jgi:hypothetical protein